MYGVIIIGGGIVGLATAYALKKKDPDISILILEKESEVACHQTGRNSGVIHSGVYYKPGSKKAILATRGSRRLKAFCQQFDIKFEECGKVIVASSESELSFLNTLYERGRENGLDVKKIGSEELKEYEPYVNGLAALHVPEAGIVNYKVVSEILLTELVNWGVDISFNKKVINICTHRDRCEIYTGSETFSCSYVINCAGLHSDTLAIKAGVNLAHQIIPFRGEYYELVEERRYLVNNLIYPVPDPSFPFLGVHFTRMVDGTIHAGPNAVLSLKKEGYSKFAFKGSDAWKILTYPGLWRLANIHWKEGINELYRSISKKQFVKSLQTLIPEIESSDLIKSPSGVRAQALKPDGGLVDDFLIKYHGRSVHICNAPSPAATASFEIGDTIAAKMLGHRSHIPDI